ncbi:CpsD/CapB family tyrosine-protein kinase [Thermosulfuriphilus sp.]
MGKIADALEKSGKERFNLGNKEMVPEGSPSGSSSPGPQGPDLSATGEIDPRLIVLTQPQSLAAEHFKLLRARLINPRQGPVPRVVMVSSAMDDEGKTFVAVNLATSVAQSLEYHALLIDCDLRQPSAHLYFGLSNEAGLSDYLVQKAPLPGLLKRPPVEKLSLLTAGPPPNKPSDLLSSARMADLIEEVRSRYPDRLVILDTTPVQLTSEPVNLARFVDTVIFVVRYGKSTRELVEDSIERLGRGKILGVVFNAFEIPPRKYSYFRSKKYYGYHG